MATATAPPAKLPVKLTAMNVAQFLFSDKVKDEIAKALPMHLKPERMIRMALTTVRRTPKLLECDPWTLVACIVQASELGLELSGPLGQAYIIPRKNHNKMEATFQIGYRGFLKLAYNTGQISFYNARAVRNGDFFQYELGTTQYVKHRAEAGKGAAITHFYGVLSQKDGAADCEVWTLADMEEHRDRFRSDKILVARDKSYRGPWDTDFEAMGCKTLIRELAKRAPLSAELMSLAALDEYKECGLPTQNLPGEFSPPADPPANGAPPAIEAARPDTLEELDARLQFKKIFDAEADKLYAKYADPDGQMTELGARAMLNDPLLQDDND